MTRRRKGDKVDGWLILDKPAGLSSSAAVTAVRRLFNAAKAGHGGTLDPLATGVLPIALGEATKTVGYAMDGVKVYRFPWFPSMFMRLVRVLPDWLIARAMP